MNLKPLISFHVSASPVSNTWKLKTVFFCPVISRQVIFCLFERQETEPSSTDSHPKYPHWQRDQELNPGPPHGRQQPNYLSHHLEAGVRSQSQKLNPDMLVWDMGILTRVLTPGPNFQSTSLYRPLLRMHHSGGQHVLSGFSFRFNVPCTAYVNRCFRFT